MGHRQIFTCLFLLTLIPLSAKALPPASPAGGNYLVLDGIDDYAVLDFETFTGYIDEGRISKEARYDVNKKGGMSRGKFKNDAKTVALWHFDELDGTLQFSDASRSVHHLVGKNGAQVGAALAVEAERKLTTTWGRLKQ